MAVAGREVADYARGLVGDVAETMPAGARIRAARRLRILDMHVLDLSVIHELALGATWEQVAAALALPVDLVQSRYRETFERWVVRNDGPIDAWNLGPGRLSDADLEATASTVDAWFERHAEPWDGAGERPVSRVL